MANMRVGGEKGEWSEQETSTSCVTQDGDQKEGKVG